MDKNSSIRYNCISENYLSNKKDYNNLEKNIKSIIKLKTRNIDFEDLRQIIDYCVVIKKNCNINLEKFYRKENYFSKENLLKSYFISECLSNDIIKLPKIEIPALSNKKKKMLELYFRVSDNEYLLLNYALSNFEIIKKLYENEMIDDDEDYEEELIQINNDILSGEIGKSEDIDEFIDIFKDKIIKFPKEEVKLNLNKGATSAVKIFKINDKEKEIINEKLNIDIGNHIFEKKYKQLTDIKHSKIWKFMCKEGGNIDNNECGKLFNFKNETLNLKKIYKKKHFPILLSEDIDNKIIYMNDCGVPLNNENIPKNWKEQIRTIIKTLKDRKVYNNDMWINNFLVKDDIIHLVDFGWATSKPSYPFINIEENQIDLNEELIKLLDLTFIQDSELRINFSKKYFDF